MNRGDLEAARGLLHRAASLLPVGDMLRLEILRELAWPLSEQAAFDEMRDAIGELEASGEERYTVFADAAKMAFELGTGEYRHEGAAERVADIEQRMEALDDDLGLAWAGLLRFSISWTALRAEEGRAALRRGAEQADRAGQAALASFLRAWEGAALAFGPAPVDEVIRLTRAALDDAPGTIGRSGPLRRLGRMLSCRGEFERAREAYREGVAISRDAGMLREAAASSMGMAFVEQHAGDLDAAEAVLREGISELDALGDRGFYSTAVCALAEVLAERGEDAEAAEWCARARETTGPADLATVSHVEALEGLLAARRGDHAEGERLARSALTMLTESASDFYEHVGGTQLMLARTLILCDKPDEAREHAEEALRVYEAKGDQPAAGWARGLLASLP